MSFSKGQFCSALEGPIIEGYMGQCESLCTVKECPTGFSENTWHSLDLNQLQNGKSSTSEMSLNAYEYLNSNSITEGGGEK